MENNKNLEVFEGFKKAYNSLFFEVNEDIEGINSFRFDITKNETIKIESSVTDYVVEDNKTIQTNITLKPLEFSLVGVVGELVFNKKNLPLKIQTQSRLNRISGILPSQSSQVQQYINKFYTTINKVDDVVNKIDSAVSIFDNIIPNNQSKQTIAYQAILTMWYSKQLLTVRTPWGVLNNMIIVKATPEQDDQTNMKTTFNLTLKQINFSQTEIVKKRSGRAENSLSNTINKGQTPYQSILTKTKNFLTK